MLDRALQGDPIDNKEYNKTLDELEGLDKSSSTEEKDDSVVAEETEK